MNTDYAIDDATLKKIKMGIPCSVFHLCILLHPLKAYSGCSVLDLIFQQQDQHTAIADTFYLETVKNKRTK